MGYSLALPRSRARTGVFFLGGAMIEFKAVEKVVLTAAEPAEYLGVTLGGLGAVWGLLYKKSLKVAARNRAKFALR